MADREGNLKRNHDRQSALGSAASSLTEIDLTAPQRHSGRDAESSVPGHATVGSALTENIATKAGPFLSITGTQLIDLCCLFDP